MWWQAQSANNATTSMAMLPLAAPGMEGGSSAAACDHATQAVARGLANKLAGGDSSERKESLAIVLLQCATGSSAQCRKRGSSACGSMRLAGTHGCVSRQCFCLSCADVSWQQRASSKAFPETNNMALLLRERVICKERWALAKAGLVPDCPATMALCRSLHQSPSRPSRVS